MLAIIIILFHSFLALIVVCGLFIRVLEKQTPDGNFAVLPTTTKPKTPEQRIKRIAMEMNDIEIPSIIRKALEERCNLTNNNDAKK